jgi:hypothetical protein
MEKLPVQIRRAWQKKYFECHKFETSQLCASIPEGTRNDALFSYGRSLRKKNKTLAEIEFELHQANNFRCQPPLGSLEMRRLIRNVWHLADKESYSPILALSR